MGDHTETIQIDFDPKVVSYEELLEIYWRSHNPTRPTFSKQYASFVFYHDDEQKRIAEESKAKREKAIGKSLYADLLPAGRFYRAEDYHQKYYLRGRSELMSEFAKWFSSDEEFTDSTAAARVNGFVGGYGTADDIDPDQLGLSEEAGRKLASSSGGFRGLF